MLRNYFLTATRSLRRHLGFTTINVIGLGVGIAVSTLLLLFVRSELAVNEVFPNAERIYRIDSWHTDESSIRYIAAQPGMEAASVSWEVPQARASPGQRFGGPSGLHRRPSPRAATGSILISTRPTA